MQFIEEKYRNKITYLSFALAIMVVIRHSVNIDVYGLSGGGLYYLELFISEITDICVPTFFAISGYLFFQNFSYQDLPRKWKSRFFSLVIPYCIWNELAYLYYELLSILPIIGSHINQEIEPFNIEWFFKSMILGGHNITWFLEYLIIFTIICPVFYFFIKNKRIGILTLVILQVWNILFHGNGFLTYGTIFLFGGYIGCCYKDAVKEKYSNSYHIVATVLLLVTLYGRHFAVAYNYYFYVPLRILQTCCLWILADCLAKERSPRWYEKLSFFIYCTHSMILESVEKVFLLVFGKSDFAAALDLIFAPMATLLIIYVLALILRKISILWRVLTGNR